MPLSYFEDAFAPRTSSNLDRSALLANPCGTTLLIAKFFCAGSYTDWIRLRARTGDTFNELLKLFKRSDCSGRGYFLTFLAPWISETFRREFSDN